MRKFVIILFFINIFFSYGQEFESDHGMAKKELTKLRYRVDSLNTIKSILEKKIDSIAQSLFDLENDYVIRWDWKVIKAGEKCKVVTTGKEWSIINTQKLKNYKVPTYYLVDANKYVEIQNEKLKNKEEQIAKRKSYLIEKYGSRVANQILNREIWIGMTYKMAIESLGDPDDINSTVGSWGVHQQWVYSDMDFYLYFKNGKLTSWQD